MINFVQWSEGYDNFKKVLEPTLTKELPDEITELMRENQTLPKFMEAASSHRAMAAMFYQQYKEAKYPMAQVTWAKEDSAGVAATVKARMIAVSVALRPQT